MLTALREGLKETGFVEGQNLAIEYRWGDGQYERLPTLAADVARYPVAVIVTGGGELCCSRQASNEHNSNRIQRRRRPASGRTCR